MDRREFIGCAASAGISSTAGCLFTDAEEYATVQGVVILNTLTSPVTVEFSIESENTGDILHIGEHEIPPETDWRPDCVWPDEPITLVVDHSSGNGQNSFTSSDEDGCVRVLFQVEGHRPLLFVQNSPECTIDSPRCHTGTEE